ncbi:MAG: MFS transporter [Gammaproteobacteria bacterium]
MPQRRFAHVVLAGGLLAAISMGVRQSFGLFLEPISTDLSLSHEVFGLVIAIQNLVWGLALPVAGMVADRFGAARVLVVCGMSYVAGLSLAVISVDAVSLQFSLGVLVGLGLSGTTWAVVLGAVGRLVSREYHSLALGLVTAGGSLGMFATVPIAQHLLAGYGWIVTLLILAGAASFVPLLAGVLRSPPASDRGAKHNSDFDSLGKALHEARRHRSYWLLNGGFLVCGFHIAFVATHLPAYLTENGVGSQVAGWSLAMIGLFNIVGTYVCGVLGGRYSRKHLLGLLYTTRSIIIAAFVAVPLSNISALMFSAAIGFLWLGTVPLTSGLVGHIFGVRYLSSLFGIVFFSHQLGAFAGAWLGGYMYDLTGSYQLVWLVSIGLGVVAALLHWRIDDVPVRQRRFVPDSASAS